MNKNTLKIGMVVFIVAMFLVPTSQVAVETNSVDFSITSQPNVIIEKIEGGFGVRAVIKNVGDETVWHIQWNIKIEGNVWFGGERSMGQKILEPGWLIAPRCLAFGYGNVDIIVTVDTLVEEQTGFIIGPFVILDE